MRTTRMHVFISASANGETSGAVGKKAVSDRLLIQDELCSGDSLDKTEFVIFLEGLPVANMEPTRARDGLESIQSVRFCQFCH